MNIINPIESCPVLKPTQKQFEDFYDYLQKMEKLYGAEYGIIKIIPPKQFQTKVNNDYDSVIQEFILKNCLEQQVQKVKNGIFQLVEIKKNAQPLSNFQKKAQNFELFDDFTKQTNIEKVEDQFYKTITFNNPQVCKDISGSLMEEKKNILNFKNMNSLLRIGLKNKQVEGYTEPLLSFGQWKTMEPWKKEEFELGKITYLHYGKPKVWYGIPNQESSKMKQFLKNFYSEQYNKNNQFLRNNSTIIFPYHLEKSLKNLKISKTVQLCGEIIIKFTGSYTHGFDVGFNISESVKYAIPSWIPLFKSSDV